MEENTLPFEEGWDYWDVPGWFITSKGGITVGLRGRRNGGRSAAITDRFVAMALNPLTFAKEYNERYADMRYHNRDMTEDQLNDLVLKRWWYEWHIRKLNEEGE